MAKPLPKHCPTKPRPERPKEKSLNSGNCRACIRSLSRSTRRSARCARPNQTCFRPRKKNDGSDPPRGQARGRPTVARDLQWSPQDGPTGPGSHRDGCTLCPASSRRSGVDRAAALPSPGCRPAHPSVSLRPTSPLPGTTFQTRINGSGQGEGVAPLLPLRALPCWPISCRS